MSNITQASLFGADDPRGVPRQRTRVKIIINSHIIVAPPIGSETPGTVNCSDDCVALSTAKTIKGGGSANFTLVPRHNYINYIFPNDWVNIWVNPGDGRGWIRIFFGFVDRIERSTEAADPGSTVTRFTVSCSDFTKAFDITHVYFNPYIADRKDFIGNFAGTKNLAGAQLRTKGVTAFGGPADIVMNYAHLLMGFGSQFMAPTTYPFNNALTERSRRWRLEWAQNNLGDDIRKAIGGATIKQWLDELYREAALLEKTLTETYRSTGDIQYIDPTVGGPQPADEIADLIKVAKDGGDVYSLIKQVAITLVLHRRGLNKDIIYDPGIRTGLAIEETAFGPNHLLDLIDFSFVEYKTIDGSIVSAPIWTQQGSLWSLMQSYSNDMINELFMDLRPLGALTDEFALSSGGYLKVPDEHHTDQDDPGVRFVPALIMREYPFSTILNVDISNVEILGQTADFVLFGPIFSQHPNVPGRKVITIPAANPYTRIQDPTAVATKHIDVAVINVTDIVSESIGRSDADVANLIEMYSDGTMGRHMKYTTRDIQPIANPISVARHGLRVRSYTTRFARFSKKQTSNAAIDNFATRSQILRWVMMLDHWYQHNVEYLTGTITTRAFPEIRVGYRLDIYERRESYYIEGVNHSWSFPDGMTSSFTLSRGQRNDPFPVYENVPTVTLGGNRKFNSRLADIFKQKDPTAVLRAVVNTDRIDPLPSLPEESENITDNPEVQLWGLDENSYLASHLTEAITARLTAVYQQQEASAADILSSFEGFVAKYNPNIRYGITGSAGGSIGRGNKS